VNTRTTHYWSIVYWEDADRLERLVFRLGTGYPPSKEVAFIEKRLVKVEYYRVSDSRNVEAHAQRSYEKFCLCQVRERNDADMQRLRRERISNGGF
jgi:hypothetical protein